MTKEKDMFWMALRKAAEEVYKSDVVNTDMYSLTIGENNPYRTTEDWIVSKMEEWIEDAKIELNIFVDELNNALG